MKLILTFIFLFPLIIFSQEENRWYSFMYDSEEFYSYDTKSIKITGKKIRVWIKREPLPWCKDEVINYLKEKASLIEEEKYNSYSHTKSYYEIDCSKRCIRTLKIIHYDKNGKAIKSYNFEDTDCDEPIPESIGEEMLEKICELRKNYLKSNK
ncbi:MAG: surface-adhesin E family protein [Ignavibacteria bacterium]